MKTNLLLLTRDISKMLHNVFEAWIGCHLDLGSKIYLILIDQGSSVGGNAIPFIVYCYPFIEMTLSHSRLIFRLKARMLSWRKRRNRGKKQRRDWRNLDQLRYRSGRIIGVRWVFFLRMGTLPLMLISSSKLLSRFVFLSWSFVIEV